MSRLLNGANAAVFALATTMALFTCPMVARAAELLILSESDAKLVRECNGKDVAVSGSNGKFILTGGCQSLTISGHNNQVLAEIAGGGELTVLRTGNAVIWTKMGEGPNPSVTADPSNVALEMTANGVKLAHALGAPEAAKAPEPAKPAEPAKPVEAAKTGQSAKTQTAKIQTVKALKPAKSANPPKSRAARPAAAKVSTKTAAGSTASARKGHAMKRHGPSVGKKIPLTGFIEFAENSDVVSAKSARVLNRVATKIRHSGASKVRIIGHDDGISTDSTVTDGKVLAKRRAQAVATWLVRYARLSRQALHIEAVAAPKTHAGDGSVETAFSGRVNIIAVPRKSPKPRVRRAGDQGGAEKVETLRDSTRIDLRNSPMSSWTEDAAPAQNLKKPGPSDAGEAPPNP
jgi:outer membrane protein OmpA-like peptidoglycan-associated protein